MGTFNIKIKFGGMVEKSIELNCIIKNSNYILPSSGNRWVCRKMKINYFVNSHLSPERYQWNKE